MMRFLKGPQELVLLLLILAAVLFPPVLTLVGAQDSAANYWQFFVAQVFVLGILALAYDLALGRTGMLSLGHALIFGGTAYVVSIALIGGSTFVMAVVAALAFATAVGFIFGLIALRAKGIYLGMITLAIAEAVRVLVMSPSAHGLTGAEDGLRGVPLPSWVDPTEHRTVLYYLILLCLIGTLIFMKWIVSIPAGAAMMAIRENPERVSHLGYRVGHYRILAFTFSGALSGVAGILSAFLFGGASPNGLSIDQTAVPLLAIIVGGAGTLLGPLLGMIFVVVSQEVLRSQLGGLWPLVYSSLGIAIIMLAPRGIVGAFRLGRGDNVVRRFTGRRRPKDHDAEPQDEHRDESESVRTSLP